MKFVVTFFIGIFAFGMVGNALEAHLSKAIFYVNYPSNPKLAQPILYVYWNINPQTVHYVTVPQQGIMAKLQLIGQILSKETHKVVRCDTYTFQTPPKANPNELALMTIMSEHHYPLQPGNYTLQFTFIDNNALNNEVTLTDSVLIPQPESALIASEPLLLDTFYRYEEHTKFQKNGCRYMPNYGNFYDKDINFLGYYIELGNTNTLQKSDFPLYCEAELSKRKNGVGIDNKIVIDTIYEANPYVWGKMDISRVYSGNYYLNITLKTANFKPLANFSTFFQRLKSAPPIPKITPQTGSADTGIEQVNVLNLDKTFVAKFDLPKLKAILKMLMPLLEGNEAQAAKTLLKNTDRQYIQYFIYNYFQRLNEKKPETAWKEFTAKIIHVNKLFNIGATPGYETERGYIYLKYGEPDEIIRLPNERGSQPYEIWQYNVLNERSGKQLSNGLVLFYKPSATDPDYKILHTNITAELHNLGWRNYLYLPQMNGENDASTAERYFPR
ncbi:MAG: GWxTD domain-containing protein [Chitinophagia bacterium]|nr:GWxTD domain-containing protein [Chitinophagia bacterium]